MEYRVYDIAELIHEAGLEPCDIVHASAAWGEDDGTGWSGGFCFELESGLYGKALRGLTGEVRVEVSIEALTPGLLDYDDNPSGLNQWLVEGADYEDVLNF